MAVWTVSHERLSEVTKDEGLLVGSNMEGEYIRLGKVWREWLCNKEKIERLIYKTHDTRLEVSA